MPGIKYYDGSQFSEVAALEQSDGQTAPAYRWDGSQWIKIYPSETIPSADLYYQIDEGSGSTLNNETGDGTYDGTLFGTPDWNEKSSARHGWYVRLDDTDYLEVDNTDDFSLISLSSDFTIGVDLEIVNGLADNATIWELSDGNNSVHLGKSDDGNNNLVACYSGSTTSSSGGISEPASTYQANVVVQWDAANTDATIYLDETEGSVTGSQKWGKRDKPLTFGKDASGGNNGPMNDGIAAIAIWDSIVSPSEFTL